jgi:hypothetical protein
MSADMVKPAKNHPVRQRSNAPPVAVVSGEFVSQKGRLRCPKCHAETDPACGCGLGYVYVRPRDLAAKGLANDPAGSNRRIAARVGVTDKTVAAVRRLSLVATAENSAVRVGKDGISRRVPIPDVPARLVKAGDLARAPYKPAAQMAKALHEKLWALVDAQAVRELSPEAFELIGAIEKFLRSLGVKPNRTVL